MIYFVSEAYVLQCLLLSAPIMIVGQSTHSFLIPVHPRCCAAFVLQPLQGKKKKRVSGERGRMNRNRVSHKAMNCTDSSKHDAISASYSYSLNPNTIRHSNTTIMRRARLTSPQLPEACASLSEFV